MTGRGASVGPVAFTVISLLAGFAVLLALRGVDNQYGYFLGYVILQSVVLATAWNVLGGYAGYVNFGAAAFFAAGAYTTVALHKAADLGLPACIVAGACVSGLLGLGTGYLALRLRGVYFSIATLSLAVLLQTLVVNWRYVGGSSGAYLVRPRDVAPFASYGEYLIGVMLVIAIAAVGIARAIEKSRLGLGLTAIRDDERAAAACGVPTLRLKLVATTISGALLGMAGAPFPFLYVVPQPRLGIRACHIGKCHGDAADRRHAQLDWPGDRRVAAQHHPTGCNGDDLVLCQPADRRAGVGRLRDRGAERHSRPAGAGRRAS